MSPHDEENYRDKSHRAYQLETYFILSKYGWKEDEGLMVCHVKIMTSFRPSFNNL